MKKIRKHKNKNKIDLTIKPPSIFQTLKMFQSDGSRENVIGSLIV